MKKSGNIFNLEIYFQTWGTNSANPTLLDHVESFTLYDILPREVVRRVRKGFEKILLNIRGLRITEKADYNRILSVWRSILKLVDPGSNGNFELTKDELKNIN